MHEEQNAAELAAVKAELRVDAPPVASPPAGQVSIAEAIEEEERREAEQRIARRREASS